MTVKPRRLPDADDRLAQPIRALAGALAFLPALALAGLWFGAQGVLLVATLVIPALVLSGVRLPGLFRGPARASGAPDAGQRVAAALDRMLAEGGETRSAALVLAIDEAAALRTRHGPGAMDAILAECAARLDAALREGDILAGRPEAEFLIALAPGRRLDLEALVQLAARLQQALAEPVAVGAHGVHLTACVGFCLPRRPEEKTGAACIAAAEAALAEARLHAPGAIRAFVPRRMRPATAPADLAADLPAAFDAGHVVPWFQPQLSTDTGAVSGMEALARWEHPTRGAVPPAEFLPAIAALGLEHRLTDAVLEGAFDALKRWDAAGHAVPAVGVNFSGADLADPMLADRIRWDLDRLGLAPERLTVEVLETVIAEGGDDAVSRTLQLLSQLGCRIDLDDFGTGHAAIGNIRRFAVGRIKIDRSFVTRVDTDAEQQTMVTAILELAQRLGLDTLAEGVETVGEHALLAQLGCAHVQGYSIARPMPFDDTLPWLERHARTTAGAAWPERRTG